MNLLIVESPAKAKTINNYLGANFTVLPSLGHIMELPSKDGSVLPDKDFEMHYAMSSKAKKYVKEICDVAKNSNAIYLATDPDREGESIAWHVAQVIKETKGFKQTTPIKRVTFNEITKQSVKQAIENPRDLDQDLIGAQQARRALDYLVGFTLSPLLWRKMPGCKSAGRVQSVALRLVCEREDAIQSFISQEYWDVIVGMFSASKKKFMSRLVEFEGKKLDKFDIPNASEADKIKQELEKGNFTVSKIDKKKKNRSPAAPFITSTLQQEASRKLGFSAKKTMQIAQKLYEGIKLEGETVGLITYMRTDGVTIAGEALSQIRSYIKGKFGTDYLPEKPRAYSSKVKNAQEAHEAIRPTDIKLTSDSLQKFLDKDQLALYSLIWNRTVACQMSNAVLDTVVIAMTDQNKNVLKATGSVIAFDGFYRVYREGVDRDPNNEDDADDEEKLLPEMTVGERVTKDTITPKQHFTEPPPRYTEASLVKKLEELGIGRPSTYASILSVLQERNYVKIEKKAFIPQQRGRLVTAFLVNFFKKYVEYGFTADLEDELDEVANGQMGWKDLLKKFWKGFIKNIDEVSEYKITDIINRLDEVLESQLFQKTSESDDPRKCTLCDDGRLSLKFGRFGAFISCSNYPKCKYTKPILMDSDANARANATNQVLGVMDGRQVYLKSGPYGWYVQLGDPGDEGEIKRVGVPKNIQVENVTMQIAEKLLSIPKLMGTYEGVDVLLCLGKFGPYLKIEKKYIPLKGVDPFAMTKEAAMQIVEDKINVAKTFSEPKNSPTQSKDKTKAKNKRTSKKEEIEDNESVKNSLKKEGSKKIIARKTGVQTSDESNTLKSIKKVVKKTTNTKEETQKNTVGGTMKKKLK